MQQIFIMSKIAKLRRGKTLQVFHSTRAVNISEVFLDCVQNGHTCTSIMLH